MSRQRKFERGDCARHALGTFLSAFAVAAFAASAALAESDAAKMPHALMPCPDCEAPVSSRALMCPACGCRGEAIEEAARRLAEAEKPKEPDREVSVKVNKTTCRGLPVKIDGRPYVVLPFERVLDVEMLTMSFVSTNAPISYGVPEVAVNLPVVRFPIQETNLTFAADIADVRSSLNAGRPLALRDVAGWHRVQPRDLKAWGQALAKIRRGEKDALPPDAHPFYRKLADLWSKKGESK